MPRGRARAGTAARARRRAFYRSIKRRSDLERLGWVVTEFEGLDHMQVTAGQTVASVRAVLDQHTW